MSSLIVGGVTVPVAPGGIKRVRLDGVDRARAFDQTFRASVTGNPKRDWTFSTPPISRANADLLESVLGTITAQTVSGDIIGNGSNLALRSEEADHAAWIKTNVTVSPNVSLAPDGTLTMDEVLETAVNNIHGLGGLHTFIAGETNTWSVYVKPNGRAIAALSIFSGAGGNQRAFFVLPTATVLSNTSAGGAALGDARITPVGGSWYRISLTGTAPGAVGAGSYDFRLVDGSGTESYMGTGLGMYVWGMQFNTGGLQSYAKTTTVAVTAPTVSCFSEVLGWTPVRTAQGHHVVLDFALYEA